MKIEMEVESEKWKAVMAINGKLSEFWREVESYQSWRKMDSGKWKAIRDLEGNGKLLWMLKAVRVSCIDPRWNVVREFWRELESCCGQKWKAVRILREMERCYSWKWKAIREFW